MLCSTVNAHVVTFHLSSSTQRPPSFAVSLDLAKHGFQPVLTQT